MTQLIEALIIGLGVGVVVGALGAGGGILAVPILVFLLNQDPHSAAASSLVIVGVTALTSLPHHARKKNVDWSQGAVFGAISIVGALLGTELSRYVSSFLLMMLFSGLLSVVAVAMVRKAQTTRAQENNPNATPLVATTNSGRDFKGWLQVILAATLTGFLTGFFGVGGGFIVVPVLVMALKLEMRKASGTSLLVMIMATLAGTLRRLGIDVQIDWGITLLFTIGSAVGGVMGGPISAKARPSTLTFIFSGLLCLVAIFTLVKTLLVGP